MAGFGRLGDGVQTIFNRLRLRVACGSRGAAGDLGGDGAAAMGVATAELILGRQIDRIKAVAVALEFIDFIVPIAVIGEKYPGGWEQCLRDHTPLLGGRVWYDDHLLRDGAMNPADIEVLVTTWAARGFEPTAVVDGQGVWKDCCVTEHMFGGPTLPCSWIEITEDGRAAFLRGTAPGKTAGRAAE